MTCIFSKLRILRFAQWLRHAMEWSGHLVDLRRVRRSAVSNLDEAKCVGQEWLTPTVSMNRPAERIIEVENHLYWYYPFFW